jgi:hypothetical protein
VSILLTAAAVAGGVIFGRWVARRAREREPGAEAAAAAAAAAGTAADEPRASRASSGPDVPRATTPTPAPAKKKPAGDPLADFPCHLGDVVMVHGGEEAWLAGALVFFESVAASALFVAPDAGTDRALYVRPKPAPSLVWLVPVPAAELGLAGEPPSTLEHKGERFERVRRVPFRVERLGTGAPDVGEQAIVAEYASAGERLLVVSGGGTPRAWRGNVLEEGTYDVLPSGKSTLE